MGEGGCVQPNHKNINKTLLFCVYRSNSRYPQKGYQTHDLQFDVSETDMDMQMSFLNVAP